MKVVEIKLKESIVEAVKEIQIDKSDIIWIETDQHITLHQHSEINRIVDNLFPVNRVVVVSPGCKLRFEKGEP